MQLAHAGRKASTKFPWEGGKPLSKNEGAWETIAPSADPFSEGWHRPKHMDSSDMDRVKNAFIASAKRADRMEIDVLEIHMAHGYLFSQFLSPDQTIVVHSAMALMAGGIDTIVYCAIVLLASTRSASNLLKKYKIKISIIFAILLILLAISLFLSLVL